MSPSSSSSKFRSVSSLLCFFAFVAVFSDFSSAEQAPYREVDLGNPILQVSLYPDNLYSSSLEVEDARCERVRLLGQSRVKLNSFANAFHIIVKAAPEMPKKHHQKIELCFHRNASVGLCECVVDLESLQEGQWDAVMSPYESKYLDIKFTNGLPGSIIISIEEEPQHWRLVCLGIGFVLLLLAPAVSKCAMFYYSSSVVLGVLLVVLLVLFQGMKLLPMGRKNFFYLTIYGSLLGVGSYLLEYFSVFVNSILQNFGLGEEMHNQVSGFALLGIVLAGAALGCWIVRKFVISDDGSVDSGVSQFVLWAMRMTAAVFIWQSSFDSVLAFSAFIVCWSICSIFTSRTGRWFTTKKQAKENLWQRRAREAAATHRRAVFLSRSGNTSSRGATLPESATQGLSFSSPRRRALWQQDYYSTFHRTPVRKYSKKEWNDFTRESTREALSNWASTPEVCDWITENAHRIRLEPKDSSSDDSMSDRSSSGSLEGAIVESGPGLFRWT